MSLLSFYPSRKQGFLMFSGSIEREHWIKQVKQMQQYKGEAPISLPSSLPEILFDPNFLVGLQIKTETN